MESRLSHMGFPQHLLLVVQIITDWDAVNRPQRCQLGSWGVFIMAFGFFVCCCLRLCQLPTIMSTWSLRSVYDGFWGRPVVFCVLYDGFLGHPVVFCVLWIVISDSMRFHIIRTNLNRRWQLQTIVGDLNWLDVFIDNRNWLYVLIDLRRR